MRKYMPNTLYMPLEDMGIALDVADKHIIGLLQSLGIDVDVACTSNCCICKAHNKRQKKYSILWDFSYWDLYKKYLQFYYLIHWTPNAQSYALTEEEIINSALSDRRAIHLDYAGAQRTVMLGALFRYLSLKFYYEEPISYFFSLLFNANNIETAIMMSNHDAYHYSKFIDTHMSITKLFCAAHEVSHIPEMHSTARDISWFKTCLKSFLARYKMPSSNVYPEFHLNEELLLRLENLNQDKLHDEIMADIEGLSYLQSIYKADMFDCSYEEYASMILFSIETFYDFQALICGISDGWAKNLDYVKGTCNMSESMWEHLGIDHAVRSIVLPLFLSLQHKDETDVPEPKILQEYDAIKGKNNKVIIKQELANLATMALNHTLVEIFKHSYMDGYGDSFFKIGKARDIILNIGNKCVSESVSSEDIFIRGGKWCGIDFYVFANGYRFY